MKKNVSFLLVIFLLFNGLLPRFSLFSQKYVELLSFIQGQPLLQFYFSVSAAPINLISKLFTDGTATGTSRNDTQKKTAAPQNTSAEFSLLTSAKADANRSGLARNAVGGNGDPGTTASILSITHNRYSEGSRQLPSGAPGGSLLFLLILLLLALRPRGDLADGYSITINSGSMNPIWRNSGLGFSFGGNQ